MATDPEIGIAWPFPAAETIRSAKDKALPLLRDLVSPFVRASSRG
jgi:dTDP-4-dehydrorhamnose 3,5-epimerase-like enzyme